MLEAIEIYGLKRASTSLLNESFANYFQKMKEFNENKPRTLSFVYLVHCSCNIFFSTFTKKDIKALFVTNKRFCGVREFDYLIAKKLAGDFNNKYVEYPMSTPKCRIR